MNELHSSRVLGISFLLTLLFLSCEKPSTPEIITEPPYISPQPIENLRPFAWRDSAFAEAKFNGDSVWLSTSVSALKPWSAVNDKTTISFIVYHRNGEENESFHIRMDSTSVGCYSMSRLEVENVSWNYRDTPFPIPVFINTDMGDASGPIFVHDTTASFASNLCITAVDNENNHLQGRFNLAFRLMKNGPRGLIPGEHPAQFELTEGIFQADIFRR